MLDVGWSELVLIGVVALIFVGPKDLPRMFHALGRFTAKARGMAREFQRAMDDAAKSSGLDDVRKDLDGVKTGLHAATNPASFGINALEDAARKFEKWDPKSVLKPAAAPVAVTGGASVTSSAVVSAAPSAASAATAAAEGLASAAVDPGPETKALAEKRAADAAAARAKAHELQAKAAASASATFAARAKADAEAAAAREAASVSMADDSAAAVTPDVKPRAAKAEAVEPAAEAEKPARKPPVRRKKSDA